MFPLNQTIRNLFIRIEAFFSLLFRNIFGAIAGFFGLLGRLSGFSKSEYFLEPDQPQTQSTKPAETKEPTVSNGSTTNRRRPNSRTDDYFLNMAKEVKKS